jgi:polysaccharide export outer membrane protein
MSMHLTDTRTTRVSTHAASERHPAALRLRALAARSVPLLIAVAVIAAAGPAPAAQSATDYVIGPQDVLAVTVFDQTELSGRYSVETNGTFSFPLVGRITAAGLTLREFEKELTRRLADGFFKNPQVTVAVEQYRSQRVFVMGEVRQPGPVPLTGGMTLIEALARAGSTSQTASGELSIVRRANSSGPTLPGEGEDAVVVRVSLKDLETGTASKNVELYDGDTIFVPRAETIYVFGEVRNPGAYPIQKDTTVLQALSLAGGVTDNGAINRVRIARIVQGEKRELRVKLTDPVTSDDTLIVPERFF